MRINFTKELSKTINELSHFNFYYIDVTKENENDALNVDDLCFILPFGVYNFSEEQFILKEDIPDFIKFKELKETKITIDID